jgi:two-component system, NtrC family, response regulator HydG
MRAKDLNLKELLSYQPDGGIMTFMGRRALLFDAVALGLLRKELISTLGVVAARNILTRFGYAHGWRAAEALDKEFPKLFKDYWTGPKLHMLHGLLAIPEANYMLGDGEIFLSETDWHDTYESEQHLLHIGLSNEPVCWTLTGWASGYVSYRTGREVYFIEDKCVGKGDPCCHVQARFKEKWGEQIEPHLPFYQVESLDEMLRGLNIELKKTEIQLEKRKKSLSCLEQSIDEYNCITARSSSMRQLLSVAKRVAGVDSAVIVTGESGAGKERVARLIHDASARSSGPFIAVNCGSVAESLQERELFGHAKGSFTGADRDSMGLFEAANGGTLFLDEIGEISLGLQVKLLRVLQEKEIRRIGESKSRPVDVRIVAATNRNLTDDVASGRFRQDLYYRLRVIELKVPPLRERTDDIMPLARIFLEEASKRSRRKVISFTPQAADQLLHYDWPGNVRELYNAVEHAVALCMSDRIEVEDLPEELRSVMPKPLIRGTIRPLEDVEREYILAALKFSDNNKIKAAAELNIGIATLYRKLNSYENAEKD